MPIRLRPIRAITMASVARSPREWVAISPPRIEIATAMADCSVRSASRFILKAFALALRGGAAWSRRRTRPAANAGPCGRRRAQPGAPRGARPAERRPRRRAHRRLSTAEPPAGISASDHDLSSFAWPPSWRRALGGFLGRRSRLVRPMHSGWESVAANGDHAGTAAPTPGPLARHAQISLHFRTRLGYADSLASLGPSLRHNVEFAVKLFQHCAT